VQPRTLPVRVPIPAKTGAVLGHCVTACRAHKGKKGEPLLVAALEADGECWCGPAVPTNVVVAAGCRCGGSNDWTSGCFVGHWRLLAYWVGPAPLPADQQAVIAWAAQAADQRAQAVAAARHKAAAGAEAPTRLQLSLAAAGAEAPGKSAVRAVAAKAAVGRAVTKAKAGAGAVAVKGRSDVQKAIVAVEAAAAAYAGSAIGATTPAKDAAPGAPSAPKLKTSPPAMPTSKQPAGASGKPMPVPAPQARPAKPTASERPHAGTSSVCPDDFPFPYSAEGVENGFCCATRRNCNGKALSPSSSCCQAHRWGKCAQPPCSEAAKATEVAAADAKAAEAQKAAGAKQAKGKSGSGAAAAPAKPCTAERSTVRLGGGDASLC
jgi:hypothetical protein